MDKTVQIIIEKLQHSNYDSDSKIYKILGSSYIGCQSKIQNSKKFRILDVSLDKIAILAYPGLVSSPGHFELVSTKTLTNLNPLSRNFVELFIMIQIKCINC